LIVVGDGVFRDRQDVLVLVEQDFCIGGHIGLQLAARIIDGDTDFEGCYVVLFDAQGRDLGDFAR
jgi:hypothetical protein